MRLWVHASKKLIMWWNKRQSANSSYKLMFGFAKQASKQLIFPKAQKVPESDGARSFLMGQQQIC